MTFHELRERCLFLLSVPKCVVCKEPLKFGQRALCADCMIEYERQKVRNCSRCAKKLSFCDCSNFYLERHFVKRLVKVYRYNSKGRDLPGNKLIYSLKQDNRRDTFSFLADELASAIRNSVSISENADKYLVTNVPRRSAAFREFGFDHAAELAKRVAKLLGVEYAQFLISKAKKAQKGIVGDERRKNAKFDYSRKARRNLKGITVILVDDVVTTGASLGACAALIRGMGARQVIGASTSIAYKDSYVKPEWVLW